MLSISELSVTLGAKSTFKALSFQAKPGELTLIVGPNGCGKSTLLKTIGDEHPYRGSIVLNDKNIQHYSSTELANIRAFLPQSTQVSFPFTVHEIVRLGLYNQPCQHAEQRILHALDKVGLANDAGRFFHQLSGGEQQRVQLARALIQVWQPVSNGKPKWLFLDEPVSSLDIGHQLMVMRLLKDFTRQGGGAVAVMHDLNLSAMFGDNIALMTPNQGLRQGRPTEILTNNNLQAAYHCALKINTAPQQSQAVYVLPHAVDAHSA